MVFKRYCVACDAAAACYGPNVEHAAWGAFRHHYPCGEGAVRFGRDNGEEKSVRAT